MNLNDRFNFKKSERKPKGTISLSEQAKGNTKIKSATPLWARIMVITVLVLFMMVILAVTFAIGYFKYLEASFDVNEAIASGDIPVLGKTSMDTRSAIYVQDKNGEWVRHRDLSGGNSLWMDLDDIPKYMQDAVVAIEDERFWEHEGVDWKRTTGAMINLVLNRAFDLGEQEYGGSTITQQLIKVTTQNKDHSVSRKLNEILAASAMESKVYTKDQILEGYLNNVPLTGDLVGVGIGARSYFDKELQELTLAECAVLASITNNPSVYDPFLHPENVRQRQQLVLSKMYECGFINKDEYVNALNQELVYKRNSTKIQTMDYYDDLVVEDVIAGLMEENGYTKSYATNLVYYGGLNIYSAEDPALQARIEAIYADDSNFPDHREDDEEDPQACFFACDYTGKVIATVGGRGQKSEDRVLNRSTQSMRSPGSSMKPITAYGPAIADNLVHYSSMVRDAPIKLPNGKKWPHNYEAASTPDRGNVLLGVALQKSLNTVAVRLIDQYSTTDRSYYYATEVFGLTTLVEREQRGDQVFTDNDLSPLALGALTDGATAREMTAAYGVFGSGGYYNKPYTYYKVTQGIGDDALNILNGGRKSHRVLDEQSAYVMVSLLRRPVEQGTAWNGVGQNWKGWQVFGKTGTSESEKDVYFAGGTSYYCASSWFGYDNNQVLAKSQTGYAKSLWTKAMKALHQDLEIQDFSKPDGVQVLKYCTETGQLATDNCKKTEKGVYKSTFKPGKCEKHSKAEDKAPTTSTTTPTATTTTTTSGTTDTTGTTGTTGSTDTTGTLPVDGTTGATDTTGTTEANPTDAAPIDALPVEENKQTEP